MEVTDTGAREPFKPADVRDLERVLAAIERIEARHKDEYDAYEFDPINQVRAAAGEALRHIETREER